MLNYEKPLEPPCDYWSCGGKSLFITKKIKDICKNISQFGESTPHMDIFDMLYIHIDENISEFFLEAANEYPE